MGLHHLSVEQHDALLEIEMGGMERVEKKKREGRECIRET
jgi:hypothetical protein